jgi:hypothetical protein
MDIMKKKAAIWIWVLVLGGLGLFSCRKETSVEDKVALSGDFRAQINGVQWIAADATKGASMLAGLINITGISSDNKQLSITLTDTIPGVYTLDQASSSYAAYADNDSSDIYAFSTNQGGDTTQAGGQALITGIDRVNKTITGTFSFKLFREIDGHQKTVANGVFYKLPYVSSLPAASKTDTINGKIDGAVWVGQSIDAQSSSGSQLAIIGSLLDGTRTVGLIMPSGATAGAHTLSVSTTDYIGLYSPTPGVNLASSSGVVTILSNNTTTQRIRGNFQFRASDPLGGTTPSHDLTSGFFSVYYGN